MKRHHPIRVSPRDNRSPPGDEPTGANLSESELSQRLADIAFDDGTDSSRSRSTRNPPEGQRNMQFEGVSASQSGTNRRRTEMPAEGLYPSQSRSNFSVRTADMAFDDGNDSQMSGVRAPPVTPRNRQRSVRPSGSNAQPSGRAQPDYRDTRQRPSQSRDRSKQNRTGTPHGAEELGREPDRSSRSARNEGPRAETGREKRSSEDRKRQVPPEEPRRSSHQSKTAKSEEQKGHDHPRRVPPPTSPRASTEESFYERIHSIMRSSFARRRARRR
ncbi:Serine/arginine repetitive matrix protein 2 [Caenorhabditis elegans]|uniref:Serine/arginine repetitive matrix protein 2 n=1 Tax=Caenorhabditis elegans TaxID=6239 RepID=Q19628_CAEEL|nr:Serine/arginine repetitive matrix protein 2 [Caenorhabditis elegans]CCD69758.2 Serine/arginine repetitive matrix protein 2 [Caenorhabditis elegans]|eukprot:NP_508713.2 Uncharacterized protein CELE_F20B6.5 [Caenorhabditis elegans]